MNFKTRIKNKAFWTAWIPMLVTFIYSTLGLFEVVPAITEDQVLNILLTIVLALGNIGVLINPTTPGIKD
jgi:phi LC3 family holin